jgi:hypothetical protein
MIRSRNILELGLLLGYLGFVRFLWTGELLRHEEDFRTKG